jgi:class 3 adenylate cyclase/tetratricopeptide (TPR) repeat protein
MDTFAPYLPKTLLARCAGGGPAELAGRTFRLAGATLFVDVSGFTPLSERLATLGREGAEELTRILNSFYEALIEPIDASGGDVMAFAGDAMSVFFPAGDEPIEGVVRVAAAAALELQLAARPFEQVRTRAGLAPLRIKIGLAAGEARIGVVGEERTGYRTLFAGEPVDAAAAAEHRCRPGDVWVDEGARVPGLRFTREGLLTEVEGPVPAIGGGGEVVEEWSGLERFLPAVVAARIRETGEKGVGEHRRSAVLFVKFLGPPSNDPVADEGMQRFFVEAAGLVDALGGTVNKIDTGDKGSKLLVLFGAPVAHEDDPRRAALAARALVELGGRQEPPLDVRIGLQVGRIFAGIVGSIRRREYTAMGDAVNLAARLMERAGPNEILVTEEAAKSFPSGCDLGPFEPVAFKGKAKPVPVAALLGFREDAAVASRDDRLVGRGRPLAEATSWLESSRQRGGLLLVEGGAGTGKTAFVAALLPVVAASGGRILRGEGSEHRQRELYAPWKGPLRQLADSLGGLGRVRELVVGQDPELAPWLGLLDELFGRSPEPPVPASADPELRRSLLWRQIVLLAGFASHREPLVFVFDDLQWVDELSLALLGALREQLEPPPRWIVAGREGVGAKLAAGEGAFHRLELGALDRGEVGELIGRETGARSVPEELLDRLFRVAGGNPLFSIELLRTLRESGAIEIDPEDPSQLWFHERMGVELPGSIEGLFLSRLDRLSPSRRELLRRAAVFGERIPSDALGDLLSTVAIRGEGLAGWLAEQEFLRVEPDGEVVFRRTLEREVIYNSIDFASRRELHRLIAELLERRIAPGDPDRADRLAHHFFHSDAAERAIPHLAASAERARAAFSNRSAAESYERLLGLLEADPASAERRDGVRLALSELLVGLGEAAAAREHCQAVLSGGASAPVRAQATFLAGEIARLAGEFDEARSSFDEARALAGESRLEELQFSAETALARIEAQTGDLGGARERLERALREHPSKRESSAGLTARMNLASIRARGGEIEKALADLGRVAKDSEKGGDLATCFKSLANRAAFAYHFDRHRASRTCGRKALELGERCGFLLNLPQVLNTLGNLETTSGRIAEAERFVERAFSLWRRQQNPGYLAALCNLGYLAYLKGDYSTAFRRFAEGREGLAEKFRDLAIAQWIWTDLAWTLFEFGDPALASDLVRLRRSDPVSPSGDDPRDRFIETLLDAGCGRSPIDRIEELRGGIDRIGGRREAVLFFVLAAEISARAGLVEPTEEYLSQAGEIVRGSHDRVLEARFLLARLESGAPRTLPDEKEMARALRSHGFPDLEWRLVRARALRLAEAGRSDEAARQMKRARAHATILSATERNPAIRRAWRRRIERNFPSPEGAPSPA